MRLIKIKLVGNKLCPSCLLHPCRHGPCLFPSTQKLPLARRSVRNTWQTGPVQHLLFCHRSTTGSVSTLWSSQEFIHLFCLGLPDTYSASRLYCRSFSNGTNTIALKKKTTNVVSLFIHKVLPETKSSSGDKTKSPRPQYTNTFSR